jgi:translation initiation factor 3 subunit I
MIYIDIISGTMFISASKDSTAKLWDMDTLKDKKTYKTERPVNSAAISPNKDHVVLGGGQVKDFNLILTN